MDGPERVQLLFGPYQPPNLQIWDRTHCLLCGSNGRITSWSDAPFSWPRCQPIGQRGGCGILLDNELAHTARRQSLSSLADSGD